MLLRIMHNHPIATASPPRCYDNRVHKYNGNPLNLRELGKWLEARVGVRFNYRAGWSRVENGRCIYFPAKQTTGIYCMWIEEVSSGDEA